MFVVVQRMGLFADVCCGSENGFVGYGSKMFVVVQRMGLLAKAVRCLLWFREWVCWLWQ